MIKGVHAMFYSPAADELRDFMRDKLELPGTDVGKGWMIFAVPEVEVACHPSDDPRHEISFYCDDIHTTVEKLKSKGVEFLSEIEDEGWGLCTVFQMPGGLEAQLYQPRYSL